MSDSENKKENKLIKPELPSGFRDALPEDMIPKQKMIDTIREVFERFGFDPMETPGVERTEVLVGGEENSGKIIFNVKGSEEEWGDSDSSLRFDLTVPLARVLAANPDIPKPFKRYQIGKVWRGERPQAGRYREFLQMDIDILGTKSLDADAEIIQVMYETLKALGIDNFLIKINNKQEALELLSQLGIPEERKMATLIAVDKKDKLNPKDWEKEVTSAAGIEEEKVKQYLWKISGENMLERSSVNALREKVGVLGIPISYLRYDASLVRGLGYYTGSVFETVLTDLPEFGAVFAGGRFDGLTARFSREAWPAVGASIGVDRLFAALEKLGKIKKETTLTKVLILNLSEELKKEYAEFGDVLRKSGINTALYLGDDLSFQSQLAYAVKKEIPFIMIYGDKERESGQVAIKDLREGKQENISKEDIATYIKNHLQ